MVVEQIPRVHPPGKAPLDVEEELEPGLAVAIVAHDRALVDSTADDVVPGRARQLASRDPRHGPTLPRCLLARNRREGTTSRDSPTDTSFADAGRADWRLMRALLDYRSEFPILEESDLLDQSLARSDAATGRGRACGVRAHLARARDPGVGGRLVGAAADRRRPDRSDRRCACRHDGDASERGDRGSRRPLLLPADAAAAPGRLRARQLPLGALPLPGAVRTGGRGLRGRRRDRRRYRRANAARPGQPRPLQVG